MSELPQSREPAGPNGSNLPVETSGGGPSKKKLTTFMLTNIALLSVVGFASILLMLFGEFDGKVVRVISTLLLFALFTAFTAMDTQKNNIPPRYMIISQVGNIYMLALSLVFIWGTLSAVNFDEFSILPGTFFLALIIKVGVILLQKVSDFIVIDQPILSFSSFLAAFSIGASAVLFTLPIGLSAFFDFGEGYWKLTVGVLLLGGLAICVSALLIYFFKEKVAVPSKQALFGRAVTHQEPLSTRSEWTNNAPHSTVVAPSEKRSVAPMPPVPAGAPEFAPPVRSALPWPVMPNGYPLPAKANGRPDFEALRATAEIYIKGESQFFG